MEFRLTTTGTFYSKEASDELKELGFEFEIDKLSLAVGRERMCKKDAFSECPRTQKRPTVEINSVEELMAFVDKWGRLIIDDDSIEIFDDFI